ncbi:putative pentatricopeptide repeat-containing protein [Hibiscus syriacus]|uniref:Pentatricopeptide repeat-containing protein n=1 Tax=Hibiscus syriacus TaxID=106335 RepID=A0A6A3C7J6_HIBSY|nr:putative pentatricopeptide repeat-containing protein [Hibiscus syriacus]
MEAPSFLSKTRTAFNSAAAKTERVFNELKSDLDSDTLSSKEFKNDSLRNEGESKNFHEVNHSRWKPTNLGTKQEWQERFRNIGIGRKGVEDSKKVEISIMAVLFYDENIYLLNMKNDTEAKLLEAIPSVDVLNTNTENIPPSSVIKQLAVAIEAGTNFKRLKDLLASFESSSPSKEKAGLSFSAVKSFIIGEKEDKLDYGFCDDERVLDLIRALFDADGKFLQRKLVSDSDQSTPNISFVKDIHGAPPQSFVVKLSEVIGSFRSLSKMALFWCMVVTELRRFWSKERHLPGIPVNEIPDLNSCLLYQQLQVINCCLSRRRQHNIAAKSFASEMMEASSSVKETDVSMGTMSVRSSLCARVKTRELVLRQGANKLIENLTMLETGEPIYSPITQEGPLLTEELIRETEELVLRTGSDGAGCSRLLSDMQAFKAANPGCVLEDFVRWHSPPDWIEPEPSNEVTSGSGQLSSRMQKEGNLWRELWETSKPVPAIKQTPLYDEDLAVEGILNFFENIPVTDLFQQLFLSLLGLGFVLAEDKLSADENLSKLFYELKDYVVATCQRNVWNDKLDELCQVGFHFTRMPRRIYRQVIKTIEQAEETEMPENGSPTGSELKRRFLQLALIFSSKDKPPKIATAEEPIIRMRIPLVHLVASLIAIIFIFKDIS